MKRKYKFIQNSENQRAVEILSYELQRYLIMGMKVRVYRTDDKRVLAIKVFCGEFGAVEHGKIAVELETYVMVGCGVMKFRKGEFQNIENKINGEVRLILSGNYFIMKIGEEIAVRYHLFNMEIVEVPVDRAGIIG